MKAYMFPGQGSQIKGMGATLFDEFPEYTKKADDILGYSIKELCLEDPNKVLNDTQYTQPALYVVGALSYMKKVQESDEKPDFLIGHSLGELNALQASGAISFESGLKIVKKRGELMSQAKGGAMAAILNSNKEEIERILVENKLDTIDLANYNTATQIVISGLAEDMDRAKPLFEFGNVLFYPLNTSGAFHSRYMEDSKAKFASYLKKFKFKPLEIPVIANVSATPYNDDNIVENLSSQLTGSVNWLDSIHFLTAKGDMEFVELGQSDVLTKMVANIHREMKKSEKSAGQDKAVAEKAPKVADKETKKEQLKKAVAPQAEKPQKKTDVDSDLSAQEKVSKWNAQYEVGTRVKSLLLDYDDLKTSSKAVLLFGHRAAVYMHGYNGYFDLDELEVL